MGRAAKACVVYALLGMIDAACRELFPDEPRISIHEDAVKAYFNNLTPRAWALLVLPLIAIAYPVVSIVLPVVVRAVVPEVVRSVINLI